MTPGEQTSFKLEANEDYMTVNTKDKNILFQMPVQISENGIQQTAYSIQAAGKSELMATPIPAGVSVVNITSKFHAQRDGVKLPPAKMGMSVRFLRGDYETTTGGKYEFSIFPSYLDYVNDLGYSMSYVMRVHHVIVTCTVFQEHRWLCIPYTHNGIGDVIVEAKATDKVPIALRITRRVVGLHRKIH